MCLCGYDMDNKIMCMAWHTVLQAGHTKTDCQKLFVQNVSQWLASCLVPTYRIQPDCN